MQNTCNLANCTLHSAHLISGAAVEWSDFSVLSSAVAWFWWGKWTFAWGLAKVRKTSHQKYCHWGLIAACVANYKPVLLFEARQSLGICECVQTCFCGLVYCTHISLLLASWLTSTIPFHLFKTQSELAEVYLPPKQKNWDEALNTWELNLQLAKQLLL